ncbi:MAG: Aconitate hydratase, partial [uncultured Solirubrobacteraceae bacterium]
LRGPDQSGREDELPGLAAAGGRLRAGRDDGLGPVQRPVPRLGRLPQGHLADRARGRRDGPVGGAVRHVPQELRGRLQGRRALAGARDPDRRPLRVGRELDVRAQGAVLRRHAGRAGAGQGHRERPRARQARRLRHHRPHLARGRDQEGLAGGQVPPGARRRAPRVQLVRLAARQPRGDDPRHVREHPPAQPARARHRGRRDPLPAGRGRDVDLRRGAEVRGERRPARHPRRQGVRLGLVARLGGEGDEAPRRPRRDRRVVRAHPPLQPRRDGRPAAAGRGGRRPRGDRGDLHHRLRRAAERRRAAARGHRHRRRQGLQGARADRHAEGGGVLPPRWDPPVRPASASRRV